MSTRVSPLTTATAVTPPREVDDTLSWAQTGAWAVSIVIPLALWFVPLGIDPRAQHAFSVISFVLLGWMTHILEPAMVGLAGMYLAWALKVVPFDVAFAGFA